MELREALISGASGADWYDKTMQEAMDIAEKIYPGIASDPNKKFLYTVALAVTSQGEEVTNNVRLADIAYSHYLEHGRFPTDIKVNKPSVTGNLRKINEAIEKGGGGDKGIAKLREFFDKPMRMGDMAKATKVKPKATSVNDIVYGSAMLGPKIGQGFYQNLNGNFKPITMDMWFMRSWGRLTNTGVKGGDFTEQIERFDKALEFGGLAVPKDREAKINAARDIYAEHEKAYAAHAKEQKKLPEAEREKYDKSELAHAAERLTLMADGHLVEDPKNAAQRHWMTDVFTEAIRIVEKEHGLKLDPAGAQATWWWPEKILWEAMGVTPKERDNDYAKALRELAKSKGVKT